MSTQLYRSRTQQKIAGVCGGIAEYFSVDVTLIRIITLFLIFTGSGLLFYIIAWLVIPEAPVDYEYTEMMSAHPKRNNQYLLGWGLVLFASSIMVQRFLPFIPFRKYLWPVFLLVLGYVLITKNKKTI